jgi:acyl-coenzyme A synthetase/AMP-(fatty) acid ligase
VIPVIGLPSPDTLERVYGLLESGEDVAILPPFVEQPTASPVGPRPAEESALLWRTSGTTDEPKMIQIGRAHV